MPLPKVPKKFLPKLTSVFLFLYVAATLPLLTNRLTSFSYIIQGIVQKTQKAEGEATGSLRQAIQPNPWDASIYHFLGLQLSNQGKIEEAIAAYRQAIRLDPEYYANYQELGKALIKQQKKDEAIANYRQAIKVNPQWAWAYNELGNTLYNKWKFDGFVAVASRKPAIAADLDQAIASHRQAIQIAPNDSAAYNYLGVILQEQGKLDEAIAVYRQAIQMAPNDTQAYNYLGTILREQGKLDEAIATYQKAVQFNPKNDIAYNDMGVIFSKQGKLDEAIAAYQKAIKLNPKKAEFYQNLGLVLQNKGKFEQAIDIYKKTIALVPNDKSVKFLLKETERLLAQQKNPQLFASPERLPSLKDEPLISLKRSVIRVITKSSSLWNSATGWVVKRQGNKAWIITRRSVVTDDKNAPRSDQKIEVEFYSQPPSGEFRKRLPAKIAKITTTSDKLDLALLEVTDIPKDIQPLARSLTPITLNASIRMIGYPDTSEDLTVATGEVIKNTDQKLEISTTRKVVNTDQELEKLTNSVFSSSHYSGNLVLDKQNRVVGFISEYSYSIQAHNQQLVLSDSALSIPIQSVTKKLKTWGID